MKLIDNKEIINKISNEKEKKREERFLRRLWRECFSDPLAYEDFYFTHVYRNNTVYTIGEKGMLHLNPYFCMVQGREMVLHYIVGVATRESERRKGIMRKLLERALLDMYISGEPFTYLMPADTRYYQNFDFVSISREQKVVLPENKADDREMPVTDNQRGTTEKLIRFVKYRELLTLFGQEKQQRLFQWLAQMLSERYNIFAKHDKDYFDLLLKEKQCQGGDIIFCFEKEIEIEKAKGFFAYGMEEEKLFIEQYLFQDGWVESGLSRYYQEAEVMIHKFPYMVRIVDAEVFLTLFTKPFYEFAKAKKRLLLTDPILTQNNGIYVFSIEDNQISVKKQKIERVPCKMAWDVKMTVKELADFIFFKQKEKVSKVFFAEVV